MGVYVNDNGTLRSISRAFVNDNGTLREVARFSVNDNGTLRHIFMIQVQLNTSYTESNVNLTGVGSSFAGFRLHSDGTIDGTQSAVSLNWAVNEGTWLVSSSAGDYEASCTKTGSALDGTSSLSDGTWLALSTTRHWEITQSGLGQKDTSLTVQIRRASDHTVLDSCTVSLHAEVSN